MKVVFLSPVHPAPGKLADVEVHFTAGPLAGMKLLGAAIWEAREGGGGRNVTFPSRQYGVGGGKRSFTLLRPIGDPTAQERVRELMLRAFEDYEKTSLAKA